MVFVGADAPTLPASRVLEALAALRRGAHAVVAPAEDGGYVLIGLRGVRPPLFHGIPWGTPDVLARTRAQAARAGLSLAEIEPWYDVDDEAGLRRLLDGVARGEAHDRAPATLAFARSRLAGLALRREDPGTLDPSDDTVL